MRIHYCQHVPFEGLGAIEDWASANGHSVAGTQFFLRNTPPGMEEFDWLIVMGGPMGVHDEEPFPWLKVEKSLIETAIRKGKRVLGVCLGAQLIADVLGARVFRNRHREIGWFPVELTEESAGVPAFAGLPRRFETFHWHGDAFDLPTGATRIARSEACDNQGFIYGKSVLALQFHLETTLEGAAALVQHCAGDLQGGPFVQTAQVILANASKFERANGQVRRVLDGLCQMGVASPG